MSRIFLSQIILRMELNLEGKIIFYLSNVVILLCNRYPTREDFTRVAMEIISKYSRPSLIRTSLIRNLDSPNRSGS